MTVFEPDDIGTGLDKPLDRLRFIEAIVAMIEDDAEPHRLAYGRNVTVDALLLGLNEIGRQKQETVGAGSFGALRKIDRQSRAAADARQNWYAPRRALYRRAHDVFIFLK